MKMFTIIPLMGKLRHEKIKLRQMKQPLYDIKSFFHVFDVDDNVNSAKFSAMCHTI